MSEKQYDWTRDIAGRCMTENHFLTTTDNEEIYAYRNGIYLGEGAAETAIKKQVDKVLSEDTVPFPDNDCQVEAPNCNTHLLNEVIASVKRQTFISRKELNAEKNRIWLQNGIYNLETNELEQFSPYIEYQGERKGPHPSTIQLPITYDSKANCPKIKKFVAGIVYPKDVPTVQEWFGYCLYKDYPIQRALMLVGEADNGKSTLLSLLTTFLGQGNVASVSLQALEEDRFAASSLYTKLADIYADLSDKQMQKTGLFKMLTGGDLIRGQKKFKNDFHFRNHAKLAFSANKLPEALDDTDAFFKRWIILTFPHVFEGKKADRHLLEKLTTQEELSGLFNWAVEGLQRLLKNGEFTGMKSKEENRQHYRILSSPLDAFISEHIKEESTAWVSKNNLYRAYVQYCRKKRLPVKAKNKFGMDIQTKGFSMEDKKDSKGDRGWSGICLKEKEEHQKPKKGKNLGNWDA